MTKEEALNKAKEIISNFTPEEINAMRDGYKNIVDGLIINAQNEVDKIEAKIVENNRTKLETEDISLRTNLSVENAELKNTPYFYQNLIKTYKGGGDAVSFTDKRGLEHPRVPNFTTIKTDKIIFDEQTILTDEIPSYIPYIDESVFQTKGYVFDAIRIEKNKYILAGNGYVEKTEPNWSQRNNEKQFIPEHPSDAKQNYVLVTLDQLVLINDYYYTKAKGIRVKEAKEKTQRSEESYNRIPLERRERHLSHKNFYDGLPVAIKKKITRENYESLNLEEKEALYKPFQRYNPKRLKYDVKLDSQHMWVSFHNMYERFVDPTALPLQPITLKPLNIDEKRSKAHGHADVWAYWKWFVDMMKWKLKDIKVQREIESEIRKIALETSFGESNTNAELKERLGILVKRQNGSQIKPNEIEQIRVSWINVQKLFGGLSHMAKTDNLKISHTADKFVYASKAAGMYIPSMKTIAVSNKYGNEKFQCIMAHEVAHYIDNRVGEQKGERYSTDNYEGTSGIIASEFRKLLNKKTDSDYINATKECFARALEQYFAIENFGSDVVYYESNNTGEIPYVKADSYISLENYNKIIKPLIIKFLDEEKEFFKFLVELQSESSQMQTELQKGIEVEQEHKDTLNKVASGEITPKEAIVETAKEHIAENPNYYDELKKIKQKIYPNIKECLLADSDNENDFIVEGTKIYNNEGAEEWQVIGFYKNGVVLKHFPKTKLTNAKEVKEVTFVELKDMFAKNNISINGISDASKLSLCIKAIVACMDKIDADSYKANLEKEIEKTKKESAESPSKVDMSEFYKIVRESKDFEEAFKKAQLIKNVNPETATYFYSKYNPTAVKSGKETFKSFYEEVKGVETPKVEPKTEPKTEIEEAIEMITELLPDLDGEQKQEALDALEMIKEL
jgi:hypothetical protein